MAVYSTGAAAPVSVYSAQDVIMKFNRYVLFLLASMALVGTNVGLGKSIVVAVPVMLFALLRFVIGVGVLLPVYKPARMRAVRRSEWLALFLQALFGTFLFTLFMLYGVSHTSALAAGVITSTIPAVVILLSWPLLKERPGPRAILAVALAMAGMLIINTTRASGGAETSLLGNALVAAAVCCESIYVILSRRLTQTLPAIEICAYTHLIGLGLMLPLGLYALWHFDLAGVAAATWLQVGWYGLAASVLSFWLWMKGIRHVPAQTAGVFTAALPVAAVAYAVVFLQEKLLPVHGIALLCVMAAIVIASRAQPAKAAAEASA
ncbi:threonine and homoserine efflux system [Amantichitinum ursilacus]|uniref:Threonine and homoserine efflux system n=2 Tax=Amantichitinum ursilacus TaxID=857265 RepID=A0A0N0XJM0_9NEIS|nr:threonine and homoserine efflux system [Amantichitinum ursilacus]